MWLKREKPEEAAFPPAEWIGEPVVAGPCRRCVSEAQQGQRESSAICYAFNESAPGGSVCWTCAHSWHDHQ